MPSPNFGSNAEKLRKDFASTPLASFLFNFMYQRGTLVNFYHQKTLYNILKIFCSFNFVETLIKWMFQHDFIWIQRYVDSDSDSTYYYNILDNSLPYYIQNLDSESHGGVYNLSEPQSTISLSSLVGFQGFY